ncbi:arginyl-trna synthetase [Thalassiosira pseudonana CCMP1335]|uniref:arginine--tRNA ligase n=1 Tax=Thalassiosira pseudonana TaxID=35128 RepID=B8BYR1_THAPS|nr:arginyl-trna synthetase [Thalassiosira pseudonana CCMP1335]EED93932.1 arginyl-trna synthetase [Thalassiosira pseudonana CCMP1335]
MSDEERTTIIEAAASSAKPFTIGDSMVTPATKPEFGDYQCNAAMSLAKSAGLNPRECASKIVDGLKAIEGFDTIMEEPEIAGPGFINLRFKDGYLAGAAGKMAMDAEDGGRLAIPVTKNKQKIIVDFSSPNIAKEMHVGHLRSTIIGDTLSNLLTFSGHDVLRLNHVGDWGTQFGMLVEHLRDEFPEALDKESSKNVDLGDLVMLYKAAKKRFDVDEEFKVRAREGVVKLQAGDEEALAAWESLCAASRVEYQKIYDLLSIKGLNERGESFYNPYLVGVIEDLESQGLAVESEGATAVFLDGYTNRDGSPLPMLVRKSDGGFNYATTDLAAIRHRVQLDPSDGGEKADRVLYVTDAGQSQHFEMVFAAAKKAGFIAEPISLEHVPFGLVQGEDGKKFATRSGDTVKLKDLLDEAVKIAGEDMKSRMDNPDQELSEALNDVAKTVGIGAVKYADLSMNRESNYKFSYGRMLSLNGNTAPYMLYAYARICGIVRKATGQSEDTKVEWPEASDIIISHDAEKQLVRNLVKLPDILSEVETDLYPNRLCDYLFETSQKFNQFYENCSVNNAETPELKASRLSLCTVSAATIRLLMNLLGIQVVEKL